MHFLVQLGGCTLDAAQGGAAPRDGSDRQTRKGAETPTFPVLSSARTARHTQPFFVTPGIDDS